ncbi:MAG: exonuclease SbcCD subunit D [Anaerolineaceae bacterium]|nr:exonuclease SbcCD subunit D [Anaerolineaceae bacterium]
MVRLLHFADAHIDLARQGRRDPQSGLPLRVLDFLRALDKIIDTAVKEKVDLVIFAGDAYRDRTPAPTYQREWGRRIMRLSEAGIQTILVVGNHDVSPAAGRAHTLHEFDTLQVPNVHVISKPCLLGPDDLNGLPIQVVGIPWLNRSGLAAALVDSDADFEGINDQLEEQITAIIEELFDELNPALPAVLTSHITVQGAVYGSERSVMLGKDLVLSASLVKDKRLSYVALGHIHKPQDLNPGGHHPVIYPGSIERVDFGEIEDEKCFVLAEIEKGKPTKVDWVKLNGRRFISRSVTVNDGDAVQEQIIKAVPAADEIRDSIFRLVITYPREWEAMIDEAAIRRACEPSFEFHLIRRPLSSARLRLPEGVVITNLSADELLTLYWKSVGVEKSDQQILKELAGEIIQAVEIGAEPAADNAEELQ